MRIIDAGENVHQPRYTVEDKLLDPELYIQVGQVLESEDLQAMVFGSVENGFVAANRSRGGRP